MNNAKKLGFGLMRLPLTNPEDAGSIDIYNSDSDDDNPVRMLFTS